MNQPNPFVPQGSLLEQHKRRSRVKLAVFCTVAISVCGLTAMLIQGCKREQSNPDNGEMTMNTNPPTMLDTNPPVMMGTNPVGTLPPSLPPEPAVGESYVVVKGDTLGKIAKAHGTTVKAIEDANPGVTPTKLKVGQKLTLPAGSSAAAPSVAAPAEASGSGETYVVKSGDSLTKIAISHNVTLKALKAANPNLDPNKIKVGQKLVIPGKAEPTTTVNTPPVPVSAPAAPGSPANGQ